ncbi:MAG: hypothetical protein ACR2PZ_22015 [Pseudomonadales bacterium]
MKYRLGSIIALALLCSGCVSETQRAYQQAEKLDTPEAWQAVLALPEDERISPIAKERYAAHSQRAWAAVNTTDRAEVERFIDRFLPSKERDAALFTRVQLSQREAHAERKLAALLDFREQIDQQVSLDEFDDEASAELELRKAKHQLNALIFEVAGQDILGFGLETEVLFEHSMGESKPTTGSAGSTNTRRVQDLLSYFEVSSALVSPYRLTIRAVSNAASEDRQSSESQGEDSANDVVKLSLDYKGRMVYESSISSMSNSDRSAIADRVCSITQSMAFNLFDEAYTVPRLLEYHVDERSSRRISKCATDNASLRSTRGGAQKLIEQLKSERRGALQQYDGPDLDRRTQIIDGLLAELET